MGIRARALPVLGNRACKLADDANRMIDLATLDKVCETLQVELGEMLVRESE
jgi:DNA-binding Xre family transcriptional regulator